MSSNSSEVCRKESHSPSSEQIRKEFSKVWKGYEPDVPNSSAVGFVSATAVQQESKGVDALAKLLAEFLGIRPGTIKLPLIPKETQELHNKIYATLKELEMEDLDHSSIRRIKGMTTEEVDEVFELCRRRKASGLTEADEILPEPILHFVIMIQMDSAEKIDELERRAKRMDAILDRDREDKGNAPKLYTLGLPYSNIPPIYFRDQQYVKKQRRPNNANRFCIPDSNESTEDNE